MLILMIYLIDDIQSGWTALHCAVDKGNLDCFQLLIQAGAMIDIKNNVSTFFIQTVHRDLNVYDIF